MDSHSRFGSAPHRKVQGVASLRSSFGPQPVSTRETAPTVGFGSSVRATYQHVYVSPEQDKALCRAAGGGNSQGPVYKLPVGMYTDNAVQHSYNAGRPRSPSAFDTRQRAQRRLCQQRPHHRQAKQRPRPRKLPNPTHHRCAPLFNGQPHPRPTGEQLVSRRKTAPRIRFGTSDRDDALKIFISPEHEKGAFGRESPGPCAYKPLQSIGPQVGSPPPPRRTC